MTMPSILFRLTGMTHCSDFPVILFQWFDSKPYSLCTFDEFLQCAPSDDRTSLGLSLYSFIILSRFVSIGPEKKNHTFLRWFLVVCFLVCSSRTSCTYRTLSYPHPPPTRTQQISNEDAWDKLSYRRDGVLTGLSQKSDDIQPSTHK